jgi:hypothetical protein
VFRRILRIRPLVHRAIGAVVLVAVIPVAMVGGALGLGTAVVVLSVMLFLEDRARGVRWGDPTAWTSPT